MKTLLVFLLACLLVGCSGGRQAVPSTRGTATAELVIQFPKASTRAIPTATQSVVVSVSGILLDKVYTKTINRPNFTDTVRVQLLLPSGSLSLAAKAYSQADGGGFVLASGSTSFELIPDEVKSVDLELSVPSTGRRFRKKAVQVTANPLVQDILPTSGFPDRFTSRLELVGIPDEIVVGVPFELKPRWELTLLAGRDWPAVTTAEMSVTGVGVGSWEEKKTVGSVPKGMSIPVLFQGTRTVTVTEFYNTAPSIFYSINVQILPSNGGGGTGFAANVLVSYEPIVP